MSNTGTIDWNKVIDQVSNNFIEWGLFILFLFILCGIGFYLYDKFIKSKNSNSTGNIENNNGPILVGNDSKILDLSEKK